MKVLTFMLIKYLIQHKHFLIILYTSTFSREIEQNVCGCFFSERNVHTDVFCYFYATVLIVCIMSVLRASLGPLTHNACTTVGSVQVDFLLKYINVSLVLYVSSKAGMFCLLVLFGEIALAQATVPISAYFSNLHRVVCLSVCLSSVTLVHPA